MKLTIKLTMQGLIRALRAKRHRLRERNGTRPPGSLRKKRPSRARHFVQEDRAQVR